jgi:hypothetical protein
MKDDYKYVRVVFFKTLPLWFFSLILLFFTVYQSAIGNPFLEDINPTIIFAFFFLVSIGVSVYFSTFSFKFKKGVFFIRFGAYRIRFKFDEVLKLSFTSEYRDKDITYGVSFGDGGEIILKVDNVMPLEIVIADGRKVLIFEKRMRKVFDLVLSLNLEIGR